MKKSHWRIYLAGMVLIFGCISCSTTSKEVRLKQSEAARDYGEALMAEGKYSAALQELLKAKKMNSDDPFVYNDLGLAYLSKKKIDTAITHFKRAIKLNPNYAPARVNLGFAYLASRQWDAAIEVLKVVTDDLLYGAPHRPLTNLGWAYFNKKDYARAEEYYKKALDINPRFIIAKRGLARTYLAQQNYAEAIETLDSALKITPRFPPLYLDLAKVYIAIGDKAKAINTYKQVIALFPETEHAEQARKEAGDLLLQRSGS